MPDELFTRKKVAALARELYAKNISYAEFMAQIPETTDPEIEELVDLITHEPKRGGWFGASPIEHDRHLANINAIIEKLETT